MEQKNNNQLWIIAIAVFSIVILLAQNNLPLVWAVSVVSVTFPAGTTTKDVDYSGSEGGTDKTAYIIGANAGQAYAWKKSSSDTILFNYTFTGSSSGNAIEYNSGNTFVYAVTNDKFWKLTTSLAKVLDVASGTAASVRQLIYGEDSDTLYVCTNDKIFTLNPTTLATTQIYDNIGTVGMLGCSLNESDNVMYITGTAVGLASDDLAIINLANGAVLDTAKAGSNFWFDSCYDTNLGFLWTTESSSARVNKWTVDNNNLVLDQNVTVGTTPRYCSISTDDSGRRLYVANEGTDNVSIVDIDANVVLATPSTCDQGVTTPQIDTVRLFNTTNTYVACFSATNSVIIDDTVSEFVPTFDPNDPSCDNPANANLLRCVLGDDEFTGIGDAVGDGLIDIGCNVIFQDCSESEDPAVNGMGLLAFIASIFVVIGLFYYAIGRDAFAMPVFIWIIIVIALSAFFTLTGLIDPIFLILSIIAVIALAAPKVVGLIQNRGFGGGSSE